MGRYEARKRENILALVMPCGHGKSSLAKKYGMIDVDDLLSDEQHQEAVEDRLALVK